MRLRRRLVFGAATLLGACVVALPAMAVETDPTIQAENIEEGIYGKHLWTPSHASIAPGGTVTLSNPTEVKHGVEWVSGPGGAKPTCGPGVPVGTSQAASGTKWSGTCTFATAGTYIFYCTVHGSSMTGTIAVGEGQTTTTMTMGSTTETQSSSTSGAPAGSPSSPSPTPGGGSPGSLLLGSASSALKLASTQHGHTIKGSLAVSQAAVGATLRVQLLASHAALGGRGHQKVQVGGAEHTSLRAGGATFAVALDARARHALHARGRLALTVRIVLALTHGASVTLTRAVVIHS
jgi:plastocyanin